MIRTERLETIFDGDYYIHYYAKTDEFHFESVSDDRRPSPIFSAADLLDTLELLRDNA